MSEVKAKKEWEFFPDTVEELRRLRSRVTNIDRRITSLAENLLPTHIWKRGIEPDDREKEDHEMKPPEEIREMISECIETVDNTQDTLTALSNFLTGTLKVRPGDPDE